MSGILINAENWTRSTSVRLQIKLIRYARNLANTYIMMEVNLALCRRNDMAINKVVKPSQGAVYTMLFSTD